MSRDAEAYVAACTHPQVKGATRALFLAIATHIPEGQTTTLPMTLPDLARTAGYAGRTAQRSRELLEGLGLVQVHDGGRGSKARYEVLRLDGARPVTPVPLPLRADLREVTTPPPPQTPPSPTPLFDDVEDARTIKQRSTSDISYDQTAINVGHFVLRCRTRLVNVGHFVRRFVSRTIKRRSTSDPTYDQTAINIGHSAKEERSTSDPMLAAALPLGVAGTRARDVQPLKESTTTTAAPLGDPPRPRAVKSPPCRWLGTTHAWCNDRFHVPRDFHDEECRKWPRRPGETAADLDAQLFAHYAAVFAAVPETADLRRFKNEFDICRAYLRAPSPEAAPTPRGPTGAGRDVYAEQVPPRRRWQGRPHSQGSR